MITCIFIFNYFCSKKENKCPEEMLFNSSGMKKFNGQFSDSSKLIEMSENDVVNAIIFSFLIAKIMMKNADSLEEEEEKDNDNNSSISQSSSLVCNYGSINEEDYGNEEDTSKEKEEDDNLSNFFANFNNNEEINDEDSGGFL